MVVAWIREVMVKLVRSGQVQHRFLKIESTGLTQSIHGF